MHDSYMLYAIFTNVSYFQILFNLSALFSGSCMLVVASPNELSHAVTPSTCVQFQFLARMLTTLTKSSLFFWTPR
jgi:hypothetical protein